MTDKPDMPDEIKAFVYRETLPHFEHLGPVVRVSDHRPSDEHEPSEWIRKSHVEANYTLNSEIDTSVNLTAAGNLAIIKAGDVIGCPWELVDALIAIASDMQMRATGTQVRRSKEAIAAIQEVRG